MSPYFEAKAVYDREPCVRTFEEDLLIHFQHGFVFSTPDYFIMGRPVDLQAEHALIVNPAHIFPREKCNCWHIYLMAGSPKPAWDIMPWPLGWFSFERRNELRFYPVDRIRRLSIGDALTIP